MELIHFGWLYKNLCHPNSNHKYFLSHASVYTGGSHIFDVTNIPIRNFFRSYLICFRMLINNLRLQYQRDFQLWYVIIDTLSNTKQIINAIQLIFMCTNCRLEIFFWCSDLLLESLGWCIFGADHCYGFGIVSQIAHLFSLPGF